MEVAGLVLAVAGLFRDLVTLSRLVSGALSTDTNSELQDVHSQMQHEMLLVHSIQRLFLNKNMLQQNEEINRKWLQHVQETLYKLKQLSSEYCTLVAKYDPGYEASLPDRSLRDPELAVPSKGLSINLNLLSSNTSGSHSVPSRIQTLKWVFSDKQKILDAAKKYRKWNSRLKDLLFLSLAANPALSSMNKGDLKRLQEDPDSKDTGLATAAGLRLSVISSPQIEDIRQLEIEPSAVERVHKVGSITRGVVRKQNTGGFSVQLRVIIEYKRYNHDSPIVMPNDAVTALEERLGHLAFVLSSDAWNATPSLRCCGYLHDRAKSQFGLVLEIPDKFSGCKIVSLLDALKDSYLPSLNTQVQLALSIAKALATFHAIGWVHKSIRSDSILLMIGDEKDLESAYSNPFLTGFEFSRLSSGPTEYTYDDSPEKDLYRHPERQGPPQAAFTKLHDIYALGVVLLEIGLWKSIISLYTRKTDELAKLGSGREYLATERKSWLVSRAEKYLPHKMGKIYTSIVISCLKGDFSSGEESPDFAMHFQEAVIESLESIRV